MAHSSKCAGDLDRSHGWLQRPVTLDGEPIAEQPALEVVGVDPPRRAAGELG